MLGDHLDLRASSPLAQPFPPHAHAPLLDAGRQDGVAPSLPSGAKPAASDLPLLLPAQQQS